VSGSRLPAAATLSARTARAECGVVGTRIGHPAVNAALANGMFGHADETDATHPPSLTHPETSVVPAALAIGERGRIAGKTVLRAIVLGYDICARLLLALRPMPFLRSGHHAGAFGQAFGAAAAAGALLKLDARRACAVCFRIPPTGVGPLHDVPLSISRRRKHGRHAPRITAARSRLPPALGVEDVFSGERDFFFTFAPEGDRSNFRAALAHENPARSHQTGRWAADQVPRAARLIEQHPLRRDVVESHRMPDKSKIVNNRDMPISRCSTCSRSTARWRRDVRLGTHFKRMCRPARAVPSASRRSAIRAHDTQRRWRCAMEVHEGTAALTHQCWLPRRLRNPLTRGEEKRRSICWRRCSAARNALSRRFGI
jgi:hypothetical protein